MKLEYDEVGSWYRVTKKHQKQTSIKNKKIFNQFSSLDIDGIQTLLPGFCWNGADFARDTDNILEDSAYHDFVCREHKKGNLSDADRKLADKDFKAGLKKTDMSKFRIKYIYQAMRKFFELFH